MPSNILLLDIGAIALGAAVLVIQWIRKRRSMLPLPPGPKGVPLLGNLLQMPKDNAWETYHEWSQKLGTDILYVNAAGTSMIVLDTIETAMDLLEKRSSIYSNRVRLPMLGELMGWNCLLGFMSYGYTSIGPSWRKRRRLMHSSFHPEASLKFQPYELKATHKLLRRLLDGPKACNIVHELKQMAGETIIKSTYGINVRDKDDPYITAADLAFESISVAAIPGAFLVDVIPALKYVPEWFPGASFQRKAKEWKKLADYMIKLPFSDGLAQLEGGDNAYSFLSYALGQTDEREDPQEHLADVQAATGTMYTAGSDTTVSAIASAILGLLEHPEVLRKAQQQIDEVIGRDRLPSFEDYAHLPYITAITKETLRWKAVAPIAIPHLVDVEDEYKGYRIPKGSVVIPNAWAMLHNPEVYSDPFTFNPDRFMKGDKLDPTIKDPAHAAFGFGRRVCPGRYLATHAIWVALASLIAVFDIGRALDESGNEIPLTHEYKSGLVASPEPYLCSFKVRSKRAEGLISATGNH